MRLTIILACGALGACATGAVTVPSDPILYEVTPNVYGPSASSSGGGDFTATIENALGGPGVANPGAPPVNPAGTPLDADTLNLTLYTIEQQKVDARIAEEQLARARSQLVIVQPGSVPRAQAGVNIALYAQQTNNAVGERVYARRRGLSAGGACGRYPSGDEAQRAFLAAGGPGDDPRNLDPDGDGFACGWDPTPYRQLRL